jgi:hypothetical protein
MTITGVDVARNRTKAKMILKTKNLKNVFLNDFIICPPQFCQYLKKINENL